jgi:hypothetical protein
MEDTRLINMLRKTQNPIKNNSWSTTKRLADLALHGVIDHCIKSGIEPAEVGYKINTSNVDKAVELDLAWPKRRLGVSLKNIDNIDGWKILDLPNALKYFK